MFIGLFQFIFRLNFCLISHSRLCWVRISVWLYAKYTLSYRSLHLHHHHYGPGILRVLHRTSPICFLIAVLTNYSQIQFVYQLWHCYLQRLIRPSQHSALYKLLWMNEWMNESGVPHFGGTPLFQTHLFWSQKFFSDKVNSNSCCVPNLKSLASTVAKISRGSKCFWMLP